MRCDAVRMTGCPAGVCDWYHGAWPHLRRLELVSSPDWHAAFYAGALARRLGPGDPVLVSGAADERMLAVVLAAAEPEDVTVLDRCDTPLAACRALAPAVRTVRADVLEHDRPGAYAAILSDAFLPRFAPAERVAVLRAWRRLLRPGGAAVTTARIGGAGADRPAPSPEMRAERLRRAALARGADDAVAELAHEFGLRQRRHPLRSASEVTALFEDAGFVIDGAEEAEVRGARFLRLVAIARR